MNLFKPTIAVYGGINVDIMAHCSKPYIPSDSNPGYVKTSIGGVGRNIAVNAALLGLSVEFISVFGGDEQSALAADSCRSYKVEIGHSLILPGETVSQYLCIINSNGKLAGAVSAMSILDKFTKEELEKRYAPGDAADIIIIDANLNQEVIELASERWKDKTIIFDPVSISKAIRGKSSLDKFSIIKPNLQEARTLLGLSTLTTITNPVQEASECAYRLLEKGLKEVFISLGSHGVLWASEQGQGIASVADLPVANVSGAGDAGTAAIAWASTNGLASSQKAVYAVASSSLCSSSMSTVDDEMTIEKLNQIAKGIKHEQLS